MSHDLLDDTTRSTLWIKLLLETSYNEIENNRYNNCDQERLGLIGIMNKGATC